MENKTHWKKNVDSRYISGEDLQNGQIIGKGLLPEMVVEITNHTDADAYDQSSKESVKKTALYLIDVKAKKALYKPLLLNKTLVDFFRREFNSDFIEDWFNKPFTLFAQQDKRHGYVARARRYVAVKPAFDESRMDAAITNIKAGTITVEAIQKAATLTPDQLNRLNEAAKSKEVANA